MVEFQCSECGAIASIPGEYAGATWSWCGVCDGLRRFRRVKDDERA